MKTDCSSLESGGTHSQSFDVRSKCYGLDNFPRMELLHIPDSSHFSAELHRESNSQYYEPVSSSSGAEDCDVSDDFFPLPTGNSSSGPQGGQWSVAVSSDPCPPSAQPLSSSPEAVSTPSPPPPLSAGTPQPATDTFAAKTRGESAGTSRQGSRRKPAHPQRSLDPQDPNIRGVTLFFQTHWVNGQPQLLIQPLYRWRRARRRCRHSDSFSEGKSGSDSEDREPHPAPPACLPPHASTSAKSCASCGTRRTPLWRDAEDGTPLCNACGIRYRKYRVRCSQCWHIPKKDGKTYPACAVCGGSLRVNQNRKVW